MTVVWYIFSLLGPFPKQMINIPIYLLQRLDAQASRKVRNILMKFAPTTLHIPGGGMVGGAESQSFLPMRKDRKTFKKYFELLLHIVVMELNSQLV